MLTSSLRHSFPAISFAVLCLATVPMHADAQGSTRRVAFEQTAEPYALVRDGQRTTFVGSHRSDDGAIYALKKQYSGNFIWFQQGGKAYVVRDPATLARVTAAWAPADKVGQDMKKLDAPMREKGAAMNTLGREMTAATRGGKGERGEIEAIGKRMDALGKSMDMLGKEMGALGKQMEHESKLADASSRALLQAALTNGTAQPVSLLAH